MQESNYVKSVQIRVFFWSVFYCISTEYGEIRSISRYSVRIRENTDQEKLRIWTLLTQCRFQGISKIGADTVEKYLQNNLCFDKLQMSFQKISVKKISKKASTVGSAITKVAASNLKKFKVKLFWQSTFFVELQEVTFEGQVFLDNVKSCLF